MTDDHTAVGSGRYSFDAAGMEHVASQFEELALEFTKAVDNARVIAVTQSPASDFASGNNAETFRNSGSALVASLRSRVEYCEGQAARFRAATGKYQAAEDTQSQEVKKAGGTL
ncbi:hypothetical protein G3I59_11225 [Amycolatopsis rubida]|uniref:Excreted virulence factor EspC, type VII ESX diderm n=2 Tax=Amycolatopsis rubida TaxID=112413 RepID=A0ABX0BLE8_9PSEU|nr:MULTISPECIES: hypothetical protein [Amycolatopsis]MYW91161.1 hypothetical protein [Amycolatopsis rubida]NEC56146.1 hypothetical protein [Amycolatopsis rubida]OAP21010.1 hypothetical protein A4R44_08220 [Amycolatopsis sp. M39]